MNGHEKTKRCWKIRKLKSKVHDGVTKERPLAGELRQQHHHDGALIDPHQSIFSIRQESGGNGSGGRTRSTQVCRESPGALLEHLPPQRLRIAQVAPLIESVPPRLYGGTERVVSYLTEALCDMGHEVTLFASGDSRTSARLRPMCARALRLDGLGERWVPYTVVMIEKVFADAARFDIIHFHIDGLHYPLARVSKVPVVTTLHGRLDLEETRLLAMEFSEHAVTSISNDQRVPLPRLNWRGTIHHGLPEGFYPFFPQGGRYLAFLGRISPEKGVDRAVEIAVRSGVPLKIAAKVDDADRTYYHEVIRPLLDHPLVECIGEVGDGEKGEFLGRAMALLMPIEWPEPFGLVMIESMACGTPVIAFRRGSVPEIVEHGRTGFVVGSIEEAVKAVHRVQVLSRSRCRAAFEERFSATTMAERYVRVYQELIGERTTKPQAVQVPWKGSFRSETSITS
jgi:glycosyltransferase involved in cell wall biosynthesis